MISTLHTFGRDLKWNPHIHALVPELLYNPKTDKYEMHHHFDFTSVRKTWQYEVNTLLLQHFGNQFRKYMDTDYTAHENGFYVYAKYVQNEENNADGSKKKKNYSKDVKGCSTI